MERCPWRAVESEPDYMTRKWGWHSLSGRVLRGDARRNPEPFLF